MVQSIINNQTGEARTARQDQRRDCLVVGSFIRLVGVKRDKKRGKPLQSFLMSVPEEGGPPTMKCWGDDHLGLRDGPHIPSLFVEFAFFVAINPLPWHGFCSRIDMCVVCVDVSSKPPRQNRMFGDMQYSPAQKSRNSNGLVSNQDHKNRVLSG